MCRIIAFVALLIAGTYAQAQCSDPKFQGCQYNLAQNIGINETMSSKLFSDYTIMYNYFLYMFGKNPGTTADMVKICNGLETFNGCMYDNKGCLDVANLAKKSDVINAYGVDSTYRTYLNFNCGPGINTLKHEGLECPQRILKNRQNVLQGCMATYEANAGNDVANGCKYAQDLMDCWTAPFVTAPCRREESVATWWACEMNRVFANTMFPSCPLTCDEHFRRRRMSEYLKDHHKIVDGEHWFKMSDRIVNENGILKKVEGEWIH